MNFLRLLFTILIISKKGYIFSMIENNENNRLKKLQLILNITQNTEDPKLTRLRNLTLKDIRLNPDSQALQILKKNNIKFKKNKLEQAVFKNKNKGNYEQARLLIKFQRDNILRSLDKKNPKKLEREFFITACRELNFPQIKYFIETCVNINTQDDNNSPAIAILMASMGELYESKEYLETLTLFFENKVQIIYKERCTLLMVAVTNNQYETANLIMEYYNKTERKKLGIGNINSYVNQKDDEGKTALIYAVINHNNYINDEEKNPEKKEYSEKLIEFLFAEGADQNLDDKNGKRAFDYVKNPNSWNQKLLEWLKPTWIPNDYNNFSKN